MKPITKKIEKKIRRGAKSIGKSVENLNANSPSGAKVAGIAAGVAGVVGVAAAIKYLRDPRGAATLHVATNGDGEWLLSAEGSEKPIGRFRTKKQALGTARKEAAKAAPSHLVIHRVDGTIQTSHSYGMA